VRFMMRNLPRSRYASPACASCDVPPLHRMHRVGWQHLPGSAATDLRC
jgi:hypothetical protein